MQKNSLCNRDRGSMIGMASIFQPREQFLNMGNTVKKVTDGTQPSFASHSAETIPIGLWKQEAWRKCEHDEDC